MPTFSRTSSRTQTNGSSSSKRKLPKTSEKKLKTNLRFTSSDYESVMKDPLPTDIIIPVMGPTGAGKSTFINAVIGSTTMEVGHGLNSCTAVLKHAILPGRAPHLPRVILLDTPGFDDTYVDDVEILRRIAVWLSMSYHKAMKLAGLIYLHDISQTRVLGSMRKNMEMFRVICGEDAIQRVILVSSKWGRVQPDEGKKREQQLKEEFWGGMLTLGAKTLPFKADSQSAMAVVDTIIRTYNSQVDHVEIQNEFVELGKVLPETDAGRTLVNVLRDAAARQKVLDERMKRWDTNDADPKLRQEYEDNQKRLQATIKQIEELKIPLSRRLKHFFGF